SPAHLNPSLASIFGGPPTFLCRAVGSDGTQSGTTQVKRPLPGRRGWAIQSAGRSFVFSPMMLSYLRRYNADLDECVEWSADQHVTAPQSMSWSWAPVKRYALTVPGMDGLLLATVTLEA